MIGVSVMIFLVFILVMFLFSDSPSMELGKLSGFECGVESAQASRVPFSSQFFFIGIIFVLFDMEILFLVHFCFFILSWGMGLINLLINIFLLFLILTLFIEWDWKSLVWVY